MARAAHGCVTIDAASSWDGDLQTFSWSHTVGSGSDKLLIVGIVHDDCAVSVSSVSYAGQALTAIGNVCTPGGSDQKRVHLYKRVNPPTGTADVSVTLSGNKKTVAGAVSFFKVNQTTPNGSFTTATGTGTTASVNVGSAVGEQVIGLIGSRGDVSNIVTGAGQIRRWERDTGTGAGDSYGHCSTETGATTVTFSGTLQNSKPWAVATVSLKPSPPNIAVSKASTIQNDPINGTTNPKRLPGAEVAYTITPSNSGYCPADTDSIIVTEPVPANTKLYVGNYPGASGPVKFTNGSPTSGLSYTYTSLGSSTDDISFSNNGGASYDYTPTADSDSCDANITHFRVNPKGAFAGAGGGNPSFTLEFKVRVN